MQKKLLTLLTLLLLTTTLLQAAYHVQVMKSNYYDDILLEELNMNILGFHTKVRKKRGEYIIYTGPYKTLLEAKKALYFTKDYYEGAFIIKDKPKRARKVRVVAKSDDAKREIKLKELHEKSVAVKEENSTLVLKEVPEDSSALEYYFLGASLGYNTFTIVRDNDKKIDLHEPQKSTRFFTLEGGYVYEDFMTSVAFSQAKNSDIKFNSYYTTFNYIHNEYENFAPYAGLILGFDIMRYQKELMKNEILKNSSYSFVMGVQAGVMWKLHKYISIYNKYKMIMSNNRTYINSTDGKSTTLLYNMNYNAEIGINFNF